MKLCEFGEQVLRDGGIFYICSKTQDHCNLTRWCSRIEAYEAKEECLGCTVYQSLIKEKKNTNTSKKEDKKEKE